MNDVNSPEPPRQKRAKVSRIENESTTYKWLITVALVVLSIVLIVLIGLSVAVIFDVVPLS
jgi:hypothetical protein